MTKYQRLFEKEIARINRLIAHAQAERGDIEFKSPPKPKRITKQFIERLKAITPETIRQQGTEEVPKIKKPKVEKIEKKTRKAGFDDKPRKGYRIGHGNPQNLRRGKGNKKATPPTLTPDQRSAAAKKAAQTRKEKGIKPFANLTPEQRSAAAKKAAQTRLEKGIKPFANLTKAQRSEAAKKAAQTRKEKGIIPFKRKEEEKPKEIYTTPDEKGEAKRIDRDTGEVEEVTIIDKTPNEEINESKVHENEIPTLNISVMIVDNFIQELHSLWGTAFVRPWFTLEIIKQITMWAGEFGYEAVAAALIKAKENGDIITKPIVYNDDQEGEAYLSRIASFITEYYSTGGTEALRKSLDDIENTDGYYFYDDNYPIIKG